MTTFVLSRQDMRVELERAFDPEQTNSLVKVFDDIREIEIQRAADTAELKRGLTALTHEVSALATAQHQTEQRVTELAVAQQHTIERVTSLEERTDKRFAELAAAQMRTDERLTRFEERTDKRFAELVIAQQRTDKSLTVLAEAQQRTDKSLTVLAEAQQRTEADVSRLGQSVERLAQVVDKGLSQLWEAVGVLSRNIDGLREEIGGLKRDFGFSLEEYTAALLPPYLKYHYGISDLSLERAYFDVGEPQEQEVDLVGTGQRNGDLVTVLAECQTSIGGGAVRKMADNLDKAAATISTGEVVKVIVAMQVHPTALEVGKDRDLLILPYSRINRDR